MPKKRNGLDTIMASATETGAAKPGAVSSRRAVKPAPVAKPEKRHVRTDSARHSLYLPPEVDQQLRDMLHEDNRGQRQKRKMHDYFLEGLDLLFKARGAKPIAELAKEGE